MDKAITKIDLLFEALNRHVSGDNDKSILIIAVKEGSIWCDSRPVIANASQHDPFDRF